MIDKLWDNLVDKMMDLISWLILLYAHFVLMTDLPSKTAEVLVSPSNQIIPRAREAILERICRVFLLRSNHA